MRSRVVYSLSHSDDSMRVDGRMTAIIVLLDVFHVHCLGNSGKLVNILGVVEEVGILSNEFLVSLKVDHVHLKLIGGETEVLVSHNTLLVLSKIQRSRKERKMENRGKRRRKKGEGGLLIRFK